MGKKIHGVSRKVRSITLGSGPFARSTTSLLNQKALSRKRQEDRERFQQTIRGAYGLDIFNGMAANITAGLSAESRRGLEEIRGNIDGYDDFMVLPMEETMGIDAEWETMDDHSEESEAFALAFRDLFGIRYVAFHFHCIVILIATE
jgi:hypothetical protein